MDGIAGALAAGAVAGIGVAMPLGAIGVLLVQQAIEHGWRPAAGGATGVALVDAGYAAVAVVAGGAVTAALAGHERAVALGGAALLVLVAVRGLLGVRHLRAVVVPDRGLRPVRPGRVLGTFVGLTLVNPLTAVYFVALAAGSGVAVQGGRRGPAFVLGVFAASLAWQLLLAGGGALAGGRLGERARLVTALGGYLLVLAYAVRLASGR